MTDIDRILDTQRPRLLVEAARQVASALVRRGVTTTPGERDWLVEREIALEMTRRTQPFAWRAEAHVRVLGALMANAAERARGRARGGLSCARK